MKRFLLSVLLLMSLPMVSFGQQEVTKFLGIPVDGSKAEMIRKLKEKGFTPSPLRGDVLEGEFNGAEVNVHVATNNNRVWRIMVADKNQVGGTDIKIRFNNLCRQFQESEKYLSSSLSGFTIPADEDIDYEITVHDKRYEAVYAQLPEVVDTIAVMQSLIPVLMKKYTVEQIRNPTEEVQKDINETIATYMVDILLMRQVWFSISKFRGEYYITMFYDNKYNEANGEDL